MLYYLEKINLESFLLKLGYSKVYEKKVTNYDYFWDGCSDEQYEDISSMAYIFIKKHNIK